MRHYLYLEQLPSYAPDLNPDEGVWNYLEQVEPYLRNLAIGRRVPAG